MPKKLIFLNRRAEDWMSLLGNNHSLEELDLGEIKSGTKMDLTELQGLKKLQMTTEADYKVQHPLLDT